MAHFIWDEIMELLASSVTVAAVDLRGHGDSDWAHNGVYRNDDHLADMLDVVERMCGTPLTLGGPSLSGLIAIRLAASLPDRIGRLVILDYSPAPNRLAISGIGGDLLARARVYDSVDEYAAALCGQRPFLPTARSRRLAASALRPHADGRLALKSDPALALPSPGRSAASPKHSVWDLFGAIHCPTLVAREFSSSVFARPVALQLCAALHDVQSDTVPGGGHGLVTDNPAGVVAVIEPFLFPAEEFTETPRPLETFAVPANQGGHEPW